jgi:LPXTG-site transpeptidase (sortase) family protein
MDKTLLKYFLVLAGLLLVIFNWGFIDWFFNYKTVGENLDYLARKTIGQNNVTVYFSEIALLSLPNQSSSSTEQVQVKPKVVLDATKPSYVVVPSIGVNAPISFTSATSQKVFANLLNVGVLHYPESSLPGEIGTVIILGHSAPPNWPKIRYDSVFNKLESLKPGSEVLIDFQGEKYKYLVKNTFFVKAGEDLSPYLTFNKSMLLLVSCWPPGHNMQRIVVEAELNK